MVPSLQRLCIKLLAENIEYSPNLECLPDYVSNELCEFVIQRSGWSLIPFRLLSSLNLNLTVLDLRKASSSVTDGWCSVLSTFLELRTLAFDSAQLSSKGINLFKSFSSLRKLYLGNCLKLNDSCLKAISQLKTLESLYLIQIPKITNGGLDLIGNLKNLNELSISNCSTISNFVPQLPSLTFIDISFTSIKETWVSNLPKRFPCLRHLIIKGLPWSSNSFRQINQLKSLETFSNSANFRLATSTIQSLIFLTSLKVIDLERTNITNEHVQLLSSTLQFSLTMLNISVTKVTSQVFESLCKMTKLKYVNLSRNQLEFLPQKTHLTRLKESNKFIETVDIILSDFGDDTNEDLMTLEKMYNFLNTSKEKVYLPWSNLFSFQID